MAGKALDISKLSIEELDELTAAAAKRREALEQERCDAVVEQVKALAAEADVPIPYIVERLGGKKKAKKKAGGTLAPKYRNPADHSQTWAGRGKQPAWVKDHLAGGGTLDELKISAAA